MLTWAPRAGQVLQNRVAFNALQHAEPSKNSADHRGRQAGMGLTAAGVTDQSQVGLKDGSARARHTARTLIQTVVTLRLRPGLRRFSSAPHTLPRVGP